ncbi:AAA family ATPase [Selenomonas sp.]|uniref:AAA family ATPase n=1 Tax=Selenomonas sp. TaxID=2053611 RepID=UPI0025D89FCC|nr:AAA family ATPase [Selenomonas sp.]MCI6283029.1 ATP-binding protein [Selenomonas sp.]
MNTAMPIGKDDFADVRLGGYYFVDKSEVIARLVDHPAEVTLFTRPRRFGKTLFLSMMRYFLDIEGAEEHRKLFDRLKITEHPEAMAQQGTRPVLFLSLKGWKYDSWERMQTGMRRQLGKIFRSYSFVMDARMSDLDRQDFMALMRGEADIDLCQDALAFLLQSMEQHYGKKPVLLLDEYDVPIQNAWENNYYDDAIGFFREFLSSALKTNPSLDFAILTGVLRISKESIFSDLNNLKVDSVLRTQYPEAFGFTPSEVEKLANDLGRADKLPELRDWYDSYRFAGREIYNPWSVLNYFDQGCDPDTYWVNTSGNAILSELLQYTDKEHTEALEGLLQGGTVQGNLSEGVTYGDIEEDEDALYTMLCMTGYLNVESKRRTGNVDVYTLRLPNREMQTLFGKEILKRFPKKFNQSSLVRLMDAMLAGKIDHVQEGLSRYLEVLTSTFDTAKNKESFYHGFVLGMTAYLVPDYEVRSNRESGRGRYDVAVFPKRIGDAGLLIEFKTAEKEEQLEEKAQEALRQIAERGYDAEMKGRGVAAVRRYGIAFCGKTVLVVLDA